MGLKLTNNAVSRLAGNISASSSTINVIPGEGSKFPILSAGDWFPATIIDAVGNIEIIRVTARSSDTLTVERGKESTAAMAFDAGCRFEHRITAESLSQMLADISSRLSASGGTISGDLIISGNLNGGTPYTSANFNPAAKFNVAGGVFGYGGGRGGSWGSGIGAGAHGTGAGGNTNNITAGGAAGGAGSCYIGYCGSAGGYGGRATSTWGVGSFAPGSVVQVVVGAKWTGSGSPYQGYPGGDGAVYLSCG